MMAGAEVAATLLIALPEASDELALMIISCGDMVRFKKIMYIEQNLETRAACFNF